MANPIGLDGALLLLLGAICFLLGAVFVQVFGPF